MTFVKKLNTFKRSSEFLNNLNFFEYDLIEFSYGGVDIFKLYELFYENNQPNNLFKNIFSNRNLENIYFAGTSAGAIFLGISLLNVLSGFTITSEINLLYEWLKEKCDLDQSKYSINYLLTLGSNQKEFISLVSKTIPKNLTSLSLKSIKEKLNMISIPLFLIYSFPENLKFCNENTSLLEAINFSSDIYGLQDGAYINYIYYLKPIFNGKALVFNISATKAISICSSYDEINL